MIRYWFDFDIVNYNTPPYGLIMGCGVTGFNYDDVINILKEKVFINQELPAIKRMIENIDISTLDKNHVLPNIDVPIYRGVWFPLGYK